MSQICVLTLCWITWALMSCNEDRASEATEITGASDPGQAYVNAATDTQPARRSNMCLDTATLHRMSIDYKPQRSRTSREKWLLTFHDSTAGYGEISGFTAYYMATIDTSNCNTVFSLDSLCVFRGKVKYVLQTGPASPYIHSYVLLDKPDIAFADYNFDGFIDASIPSGASGSSNVIWNYYLFEEQTKTFRTPLSLVNAGFDPIKRQVRQSWYGGHAGKIGGYSISEFTEADSLVIVESENRQYLQELDLYVHETRVRKDGGRYVVSQDTVQR